MVAFAYNYIVLYLQGKSGESPALTRNREAVKTC
jgi:hypothetical protein